MEIDLLPSASMEAQLPPTSMDASIYFHLLPWKLPPTSIEASTNFHGGISTCSLFGSRPVFMKVAPAFVCNRLLPSTSIYQIRRNTLCKPMKVGQARSGCLWTSQEKWMGLCVEATKVGESRWKVNAKIWNSVCMLVEVDGRQ